MSNYAPLWRQQKKTVEMEYCRDLHNCARFVEIRGETLRGRKNRRESEGFSFLFVDMCISYTSIFLSCKYVSHMQYTYFTNLIDAIQ